MGETSTSSSLGDKRRKSRNADGINMKAIVAVLVCFSVLRIFAGAPDSIQTEAILDERADRMGMELEIKLEVPVLTVGPTTLPQTSPPPSHPTSSPNLPPAGPPTRAPIVQLVTIPKTVMETPSVVSSSSSSTDNSVPVEHPVPQIDLAEPQAKIQTVSPIAPPADSGSSSSVKIREALFANFSSPSIVKEHATGALSVKSAAIDLVNLSFVNTSSSSPLGSYSDSGAAARSDVDAANGTLGLSPFRILCTSNSRQIHFGSYKIRCLDLKHFTAKYFPNVEIDAIPFETATGHYNATILVKQVRVGRIKPGHRYGRVFVDVVDNYDGARPNNIPKNFEVILQNQAHANSFPNHTTHVVTHWYNSFLADDKEEFFGTLPAIKYEDNLKVATVWNSKSRDRQPSQPANVSYDIIAESFNIQSWYHKYVPGDTTFNQTMADAELGPGYLYRILFQKYHLLVAYAKNGPKLDFGNVQRIVSQMRSGVPVLVEDRGYAHSEFIRKYSYPCKFTDNQSFQEILERMKSPLLRQECQRLGIEISKDFSPRTIVREFLRVLGMFE
jgi:hypothetical protein